MAFLVSGGNHNLTAASWRSTTGTQLTGTSNTTLTTSYVYSSNFTPGAVEVDGMMVLVAAMGVASPTGTIDIVLRNTTGGVDVATVTVNISDLLTGRGDSNAVIDQTSINGGWLRVGFSAVTLLAATNYAIGLRVSSGASSVNFFRDATAGNWNRAVILTATASLAAGDDAAVVGVLTGAGASTTHTVTMNSTANTDYGSAQTDLRASIWSVSRFGTLAYGTTASTNYILRISGNLIVCIGGTLMMGQSSGTSIPRSSTALLEFDSASDAQFGLQIRRGGLWYSSGESRTSGKDVVACLMTADAAAAATSISVNTDTGWLSGDVIGIFPSFYTQNQGDKRTLSANAGASSISIDALSFAHEGNSNSKSQAEVILLTRNVKFQGVTAGSTSYIFVQNDSLIHLRWTEFNNIGDSTTNRRGLETEAIATDIRYCSFHDSEDWAVYIGPSTNATALSVRDCGVFEVPGGGSIGTFGFIGSTSHVSHVVTIDNVWVCPNTNTVNRPAFIVEGIWPTTFTFTNNRGAGCYIGLLADGVLINGASISNITLHSVQVGWNDNGTTSQYIKNTTFDSLVIYRTSSDAIKWPSYAVSAKIRYSNSNNLFTNWFIWGFAPGLTAGAIEMNGIMNNSTFRNCRFMSDPDTSFSLSTRVFTIAASGGPFWFDVRFESCNLGQAETIGGVAFRALNTAGATDGIFPLGSFSDDFSYKLTCINCKMGSEAIWSYTNTMAYQGAAAIAVQNYNEVAGDHRLYTNLGTIQTETTTVDVSPSVKMTPLSASVKLESNGSVRGKGILVPVGNGETATVSCKVRKNGTYNGNQPRLVVKANPAVGISSDTVLDTMSVGADTWETLSGVTSSATAAGVVEVVVDCDGTAGSIFIDTATAA